MNIENMEKLIAYVEEEPRRLAMEGWYHADHSGKANSPPCGAVACLAGNACIISGMAERRMSSDGAWYHSPTYGWYETARGWLRLSGLEADRLFYLQSIHWNGLEDYKQDQPEPRWWPLDLEARYLAARTPAERVAVTVERIRRFIATDGKE